MEGNQTMRTQPTEHRGPYIGERSVAQIVEGYRLPSRQQQRQGRVLRARRELDDATFAELHGRFGDASTLKAFVRSLTDPERRVLVDMVGDDRGGRS